jgi:MFS transporter, ACS family, glucarate transporter
MSNKSNRYSSKQAILTLLFLGWCVGNLNRFTINYAILDIAKDFNMNASMNGLIMSSFFVGYAIMQIPGGWLADKFGPKKVILTGVIIWSVSAALTGISWSLASLMAFRFLTGVGTGIFFPTASRTIAMVFPRNGQGKAQSVLLVSGAVIGAISSVLFAWIIGTLGWSSLFFISGACGIIVIVFYLPFFKVAPSVKEAEDQVVDEKPSASPLKQVIKIPMIWGMFISGFCVSMITWGINSWIPTVLVEIRHIDLMQAGKWQVMPLIFGVIAMLLCGVVVDKMQTRAIRILAIVLAGIAAASVYLMYVVPALVLFFVFEGIAIACVTAIFVIINNLVMRQFSVEVTGSAIGFMNFGSQIGSFIAPTVMGLMVDANNGSFYMAFTFLAVAAVIAGIAFIPNYFSGKDVTAYAEKSVI